MKIAKKTLSVFLSLLMIFGSCSVCLSGLSFSAAAASVQTVKDTVSAAASAIAKQSSSNNAFTYTNDDGTVMAAAEEVYAYVASIRQSGSTAGNNATDALLSSIATATGYNSGQNYDALVKLINPAGTDVRGYARRATSSTEHWPGASHNYPSLPGNDITKSISIKSDLNSVLLNCKTVNDIPATILLDVKYTYTHTSTTNVKSCSYKFPKNKCETEAWNYLSSINRTVSSQNTDARNDFLSYAEVFTDDKLNNSSVDELLKLDSATLTNDYNTAVDTYNAMKGKYTTPVIEHFFGVQKIETYISNVEFAMQVKVNQPNVSALMGYMATEYDVNNLTEMETLYTNAKTALDSVKACREDVRQYIVENYDDCKDFTIEAADAFLTKLGHDIDLYNLRVLRASMLADADKYSAQVADPENREDIAQEELESLYQRFTAYITQRSTFDPSYVAEVFSDDDNSKIDAFRSALQLKVDTRDCQFEYDNYWNYFLPFIYANVAQWTNEEIMNRYDLDTAKDGEMEQAIEKQVGIVGQEIVTSTYTFTYGEDVDKYFPTAVDEYIERLKVNIIARNRSQLEAVAEYKDMSADVNFDNFIGLDSAIGNLDESLYNYVDSHGWLEDDLRSLYGELGTLRNAYQAFVDSGGLDKFKQEHYHDANGVYTTRYAGDQEVYDEQGNNLSYPNDLARNGEKDNYVVDEEKVNATIAKLDSFITSEDFCALVGLKDKDTGEAFGSLPEAIDNILTENIFNDKMINTLVSLIFPMVCDLIGGLIGDLGSLGVAGIYASDRAGASAKIALGELNDTASGDLYVYVDGQQGTTTLAQDFESLGVYIYPASLAKKIPNDAKYSAIKTALTNAGNDWNKVLTNSQYVDEEGKLNFTWGVSDYNTFIDAVGIIFDAMLPLLQTILVGQGFDKNLPDSFAYGISDALTVKYKILGITSDITVKNLKAVVTANLKIDGLNLYKDLWIPVMETLGVTDGGYTFKSLASNASARNIADAMFEPVYTLIGQLKSAPLNKVLEILPGVLYALSMNRLQTIINGIQLPLHIKLSITDVKDGDLGIIPVDWLLNLLKGTISNALPSIDQNIELGSMLQLDELLGSEEEPLEYTNLNVLIKYLFDTLGLSLSLPIINAGEVIVCSSYQSVYSSARGANRLKFTADKADVFYFLLQYIVNAVGNREFIEGIIEFIQNQNAEEGEEPAPIELPDIVYSLIEQVGTHPMDALAALVELFNPVKYDTMDMDWFQSKYSYNVENMDDTSIVYLEYRNDWTRDKANYVIDNIDAILESVLKMTGSEVTSVNDLLQTAISGLFNNKNMDGLINGLVDLGVALDKNLEDSFLYDFIARETGVNMRTWFNAFGYLYNNELGEKYGVTAPAPGEDGYVNETGVTAGAPVTDEEGNTYYTWIVNGKPFEDGDRNAFLDIFTGVCGEFAPLVSLMFSGQDLTLFNQAITFLGYENYKNSVGMLFEIIMTDIDGLDTHVLTQEEYNAMAAEDPAEAFNFLTKQLFDWVDYMLDGNTIQKTLELLPRFVYFIESNGLSTLIHNLLMPVLIILDDVRPIIDLDVNSILSLIVSDLLNTGSVDFSRVLDLISGNEVEKAEDYKQLNIDIGRLTLAEIVKLVDSYIGTDLYGSQLVQYGLDALCAGAKEIPDSVLGTTAYGGTVTAADALTITVTSLLEALQYEVKVTGDDGSVTSKGTNGEILCAFIQGLLGEDATVDVTAVYNAVVDIINGLDIQYSVPDWDYMFEVQPDSDTPVKLPQKTIVYLGYNNDWSKNAADTFDAEFDELVDYVLKTANVDISGLINGLLADNVYSDANLNTIVELIVNAISALDSTLRDLVDATIDTDISSWFGMCELGEDGKYICTKDWGVDAAADEAAKKDAFIAGIKEVLNPANRLLAWLFLGDDLALFTGSETNENGELTYNDVITVTGGEGYAYGLVPILEALGCKMTSPDDYVTTDENGKTVYNVGGAVEDIIDSVLARVDEIAGKPAHEILNLLPNIIYFINAEGVKTSVNNLLAPVNAVIEKLSPIIAENGDDVSIGALLKEQIGFDITDLTMETVINILKDKLGLVLNDEMAAILTTFYIGDIEKFDSANGEDAYRMVYTNDDYQTRADMITIVLSFALDLVNENGDLLKDLIGDEDIYNAIVDLLNGHNGQFEYAENNWAYMYEGDDALEQLIANGLPARTGENSIVYTQYTNAWNKATADYLNSGLSTIIESIVEAAKGEGNTIGILLDAALSEKLYTDAILDQLLEAVVKLFADLDNALVTAVGAVLGVDIATWFSWCDIQYNDDGSVASVTCTKDWGIDAKATNAEKKEQFIESFAEALEPANRVIDWLFFGKDYTFLDGTTKENLIMISGGEGYAFGLVPLLEALGCENVKSASEFVTENGINTSAAVRYVFEALCERLTAICGKDDMGALDVMLDILPNIVYFINADGAKNTVNNLLQPVYYLIETLSPVVGDVNLDELIGFPLSNLTFDAVFDIVNDKVGLYFNPECEEFVKEFYMGKVEQRDSANGRTYFYMTYSDTETRRDMITILLSLVLDTMKVDSNEAILTKWFGEDVYKTIKNILGLSAAKDMQDFSWYYTEYANTDESFSAIESSGRYTSTYNEYWTKEKAQYVVENLPALIGNVLCLAGIESDGMKLDSLEHLLDSVIQSNLYTQANADAILNMLKDALAQITGLEPYGEYIAEALKNAVDLDLHAWDNMTVEVVDGDRESFTNALTTIIAPAAPLLKLLLTGESISLFLDINGLDAVTIPGSLGYAYGIIPLLEALDCEGILTPDEFKVVLDSDANAALKAVVDPVFDKIEAIEANPVDQIFSLLPGVVYFINSNGLDTCFKNLVNSVDTVLAAIEPATGKGSLEDLMGFDLSTYDFDWIVDTALNAVKESTGYDLTPFVMDAIAELTVGKVVTYESKNGETYYTMEYTSELQKADMLTIALRILIDFATMDENIDKIEALIKDYIPDEENYNSVCSVLEMLADSVSKDPGMGQALYIFYYIFLGVNEGAEVGDDVYHDVNNSWQFILRMLTESSDPFLRGMGNSLKGILNKYFDGIFDDEGLASNGFVEFFKKIAEFFNKIIEFFKNLFSKG